MSQNKKGFGREYAKWSGIALQGVAAIVVLLFLGRFIDQKNDFKTPVFTISGILLGVLYFFYNLFRAAVNK